MFHKEGYKIILISMLLLSVGIVLSGEYIHSLFWQKSIQITLLIFSILILQFFRNPKRQTHINDRHIIAPVDGKVVAIEEVEEKEFFHDKRRQISIFMTPLNVHVTRYPVSGKVIYSQYHKGEYLVASHPKASSLNERTTIVVENPVSGKILYRQVAGFVARRIVNYAQPDMQVIQGTDAGFIKFGSRVDILIPLDYKVSVVLGEKIRGGEQIIAEMQKPIE
jgi:phosphatidylserine decarboxylase